MAQPARNRLRPGTLSAAVAVAAGVAVAAASEVRAEAGSPGLQQTLGPIVDGQLATEAERYGTVALIYTSDGEVWCTGTLVAPRVVVTAAHCVVDQDLNTDAVIRRLAPSEVIVAAGPLDMSQATDADAYEVTRITVHPGFPNDAPSDHPTGANRYDDLAVLVLASPVTGIAPVVIPDASEADAALVADTALTISGYGTVDADGRGGGVLYIAETPFVARVGVELVAGRAGAPDTCPGDSGGPAYLFAGGSPLLVGVTSRSSQDVDAACGEGGVYGFAPAYREWIAANSDGLYAPGSGGPTEPLDEPTCDPETEDCGGDAGTCDPETEDCGGDAGTCDPETEDCGEDAGTCDPETEDCGDGCGAAGSRGGGWAWLAATGLLLAFWRARRARTLTTLRPSMSPRGHG